MAVAISGGKAWVLSAMDVFDRQGPVHGTAALGDTEKFARQRAAQLSGLALDEVFGVLE